MLPVKRRHGRAVTQPKLTSWAGCRSTPLQLQHTKCSPSYTYRLPTLTGKESSKQNQTHKGTDQHLSSTDNTSILSCELLTLDSKQSSKSNQTHRGTGWPCLPTLLSYDTLRSLLENESSKHNQPDSGAESRLTCTNHHHSLFTYGLATIATLTCTQSRGQYQPHTQKSTKQARKSASTDVATAAHLLTSTATHNTHNQTVSPFSLLNTDAWLQGLQDQCDQFSLESSKRVYHPFSSKNINTLQGLHDQYNQYSLGSFRPVCYVYIRNINALSQVLQDRCDRYTLNSSERVCQAFTSKDVARQLDKLNDCFNRINSCKEGGKQNRPDNKSSDHTSGKAVPAATASASHATATVATQPGKRKQHKANRHQHCKKKKTKYADSAHHANASCTTEALQQHSNSWRSGSTREHGNKKQQKQADPTAVATATHTPASSQNSSSTQHKDSKVGDLEQHNKKQQERTQPANDISEAHTAAAPQNGGSTQHQDSKVEDLGQHNSKPSTAAKTRRLNFKARTRKQGFLGLPVVTTADYMPPDKPALYRDTARRPRHQHLQKKRLQLLRQFVRKCQTPLNKAKLQLGMKMQLTDVAETPAGSIPLASIEQRLKSLERIPAFRQISRTLLTRLRQVLVSSTTSAQPDEVDIIKARASAEVVDLIVEILLTWQAA